MSEFTVDQARAIVYDAYTSGLAQSVAVKLLCGRATPAWVKHEYAALKKRGISSTRGQQAFDFHTSE
ncbi:hypothetical protein ACFXPT_37815 [Streptomyces goshikiensis]|uniref:hypothetical protein n=1 Tax=Streptomyces goshikiensis TaxID=1942 RepID=UPI0036AD77BE